MKIQKNKSQSAVTGVENKMQFSVDTNNQMIISILRDKLYSNKIAAVCREVSSNSRDANREAGREDVPVIITIDKNNYLLSEEGEITIGFKDSGIGITPDRIENVFLKYGNSTKRDSNLQTGGFGIGAKTPFAYSKEFMIVSVSEVEGKTMKHTYQAAIVNDESGIESSELFLIDECETTEKTGTEIIVPIQSEDLTEFQKEVFRATFYWEVKPVLNGFEDYLLYNNYKSVLDFPNSSLHCNNAVFGLLKISNSSRTSLNIDGIAYPFDLYKLIKINDEEKYNKFKNSKTFRLLSNNSYANKQFFIELSFKTGELSLSASREEIEYTKENSNTIIDRILEFDENLLNHMKSEVNKLKTFQEILEFKIKFNTAEGALLYIVGRVHELDNFVSNERVDEFLKVKTKLEQYFVTKPITYSFHQYDTFRFTKSKVNSTLTDLSSKNLSNKLIVLKAKNERSNSRKNKTLLKLMKEQNKSEILFVEDSFEGLKKYDRVFDENLDQYIEELVIDNYTLLKDSIKDFNIIDYSKVEKAPLEKRAYVPREGGEKKEYKKREVPVHIKTLFTRKYLNFRTNPLKIKMRYDSKENVITNFNVGCKSEQEIDKTKIVFLTTGEFVELNELNNVGAQSYLIDSYSLEGETFELEDKNCIYKLNEEAANENNFNKFINSSQTKNLLYLLGYEFVVINKSCLEKIKNTKDVHFGLKSALKEVFSNKEFKKQLKNVFVNNYVKELGFLTKDSTVYTEYINDKLSYKYSLLSGFDLKKCNLFELKKIEEDNDLYRQINSHYNKRYSDFNTVIKIAMNQMLNLKDIEKKYDNIEGFVKTDFVVHKIDSIAKKFPLIFFAFDNIKNDSVSYRVLEKASNSREESLEILEKELETLIDIELKKINK
jgi:hypothetical protein